MTYHPRVSESDVCESARDGRRVFIIFAKVDGNGAEGVEGAGVETEVRGAEGGEEELPVGEGGEGFGGHCFGGTRI